MDGEGAGSGMSLTAFLAVGMYTIEATAIPVVGVSDTKQVTVTVVDTRPPVVDAAFVDHRTGEVVVEAANGKVEVRYSVIDDCDPSPTVEAVVVPVYAVMDGQVLKVKGEHRQVRLPTSALNLTVTATDAAGNTASGEAVLHVLGSSED